MVYVSRSVRSLVMKEIPLYDNQYHATASSHLSLLLAPSFSVGGFCFGTGTGSGYPNAARFERPFAAPRIAYAYLPITLSAISVPRVFLLSGKERLSSRGDWQCFASCRSSAHEESSSRLFSMLGLVQPLSRSSRPQHGSQWNNIVGQKTYASDSDRKTLLS